MLKKIILSSMLFTALMLSSYNYAGAFGVGLTLKYGSGSATYTYDFADLKLNPSLSLYGLGAVIDTRLAKDGLINYRASLMYEFGHYEYISESFGNSDDEYSLKISLDNTLGFGLIRNENLRLWIGPTLRLTMDQSIDTEYEQVSFGIGLGATAGLNFNFGKLITLSAETGYISTSNWGIIDNWRDNHFYSDVSEEFTMTDNAAFFKISLIFRIKDIFEYGK